MGNCHLFFTRGLRVRSDQILKFCVNIFEKIVQFFNLKSYKDDEANNCILIWDNTIHDCLDKICLNIKLLRPKTPKFSIDG